MTRFSMAVLLLALMGSTLHGQEDAKAAKIRDLMQKYSSRVVVLTWSSRTSAMGQNVDTVGTATGVLAGEKGLFVASNQPFAANVSGMASMFGGGRGQQQNTGPQNFRVRTAAGIEFDAIQALEHKDENLRYFGAKLEEGMGLASITFPEKAEVPALGEEVLLIGAHDATLNYARFFRLARINAVVEDGKYYGLDGSVQDCLGALVLTLDGKVLGLVGQKPAPVGQNQDPTGFGRILGGLNDPSRALGNRVLMTSAAFAAGMKDAQTKVLSPDFGKDAPTTTLPVKPEPTPAAPTFDGLVASATRKKDNTGLFVLVDVKSGDVPAIGDELVVQDEQGKEYCRLKVSRHYKDPTNPEAKVDQIGGDVADAEAKLTIQKGWKVVGLPKTAAQPAAGREFRGVDRFMKVGEDVLGDSYAGHKVGFLVSGNPRKDSPCKAAGLKAGDVIVKVGETEIKAEHTLDDLWKLLQDAKGELALTVVRKGGEKAELKVAP